MANDVYVVDILAPGPPGKYVTDDGTGIDWMTVAGTYQQVIYITLIASNTNGIATSASGFWLTVSGLIENVRGSNGADNIVGNQLGNLIYGDKAATGSGGHDTVYAGRGNDTVYAGTGNDHIFGYDGSDRLFGNAGNDTINGENGIDVILGGAGADTLEGERGNDTLIGGAGDDKLIGGEGKDTLRGGAGNDVFRFQFSTHSTVGNPDVIFDFDDLGNDRIDVSTLFGPAMTFRGTGAFTGAGQVRIVNIAGPDVRVEVNTGGSLAADFAIRLKDTAPGTMTGSDFFL